ncbi:MAG: hypothetical protein WA705_29045 [Candidatus Ozemobacteraceae bacterium]
MSESDMGVILSDEGKGVLLEISRIVEAAFPVFSVVIAPDGLSFQTADKGDPDAGIETVSGTLSDQRVVVTIGLKGVPSKSKVSLGPAVQALSRLSSDRFMFSTRAGEVDGVSFDLIHVEMKIAPQFMNYAREKAFHSALMQIREASLALREMVPEEAGNPDLEKIFKPFKEHLEAQTLLGPGFFPLPAAIEQFTSEAFSFLESGASIALVSPFELAIDLSLACLAHTAAQACLPIARFIATGIQVRGIVDLVRLAPGIIAFPARSVSLASNPYELTSEAQSMVDSIFTSGKPAIFTGSFEQQQIVFSGGQTGRRDPLKPVIVRIPDLPLDLLTRFAVELAGRKHGIMMTAQETQEVVGQLGGLTETKESGDAARLLPLLAMKAVKCFIRGKSLEKMSLTRFLGKIATARETFAGYSMTPRSSRLPEVQENFQRVAFSGSLGKALQEALVGQEQAVSAFESRFRSETLHRPLPQPIRIWGVGPAGTGKSVSTRILAQHLSVPHIQIDCSGFADFYSALASLTGSGRGIVGSHTPGKLQAISQLPAGAVVEVSELDHASNHIRAQLADFYLQGLDTGEAQSAMGSTFSLANVVFYFTMNLPEGMDLKAWKGGVGFRPGPLGEGAVARNVAAEMQKLFSSAFLSRMGDPILFAPLEEDSAVAIFERSIREELTEACRKLGIDLQQVSCRQGMGKILLPSFDGWKQARGARAIQELARKLVSDEIARLGLYNATKTGKFLLEVSPTIAEDRPPEITIRLITAPPLAASITEEF